MDTRKIFRLAIFSSLIQRRFLSGRWSRCVSNFHLRQAVKLKAAQAV